MMSIKKRKKNKTNDAITLREQFKQVIDVIDGTDEQIFIDECVDDICKVLQEHIDIQIKHWTESFQHHQRKEEEWKYKVNFDLSDIHHSMKIYSNGAAHALQFFKDELLLVEK